MGIAVVVSSFGQCSSSSSKSNIFPFTFAGFPLIITVRALVKDRIFSEFLFPITGTCGGDELVVSTGLIAAAEDEEATDDATGGDDDELIVTV